jgi:hypothetical protein
MSRASAPGSQSIQRIESRQQHERAEIALSSRSFLQVASEAEGFAR